MWSGQVAPYNILIFYSGLLIFIIILLMICLQLLSFFLGWFFDWTGTYDIAFYFCGISVLMGGLSLLLVALPCWKNCGTNKSEPFSKSYSYKVAATAWRTEEQCLIVKELVLIYCMTNALILASYYCISIYRIFFTCVPGQARCLWLPQLVPFF